MIEKDLQNQIYRQIGINVKRQRIKARVSQLALANNLGYKSVSLISMGENYQRNVHFNIEHLIKIAIVLNVRLVDLLDGVEEIINKNRNFVFLSNKSHQ